MRIGFPARLAISAVVFAAVLHFVDIGRVFGALRSARAGWFVAALSANLLSVLLGGFVVSHMCSRTVGPFAVARVNLISVYFGTFLPGDIAAGLVSRIRYLGLGSWRQVVGVSILERLLGLAAFSVLAAVALCFSTYAKVLGLAPFALPAVVLVAAIVGILVVRGGERIRGRMPVLDRMMGKVLDSEGVANVRGSAVAYSTAAQLTMCLVPFSVLRSLHLEVSYADSVVVAYFLTLAQLVPFFFAGIGIRDASVVALFRFLGIDAGDAIAFSTLVLALVFVLAALGGILQIHQEGAASRE